MTQVASEIAFYEVGVDTAAQFDLLCVMIMDPTVRCVALEIDNFWRLVLLCVFF